MNQIFNRIKRIIKANSNTGSGNLEHSEDDDLKKIIDELNNSSKQNNTQESRANTNTKGNNPYEVKVSKALKILGLSPNAKPEEIKQKYKSLIKQYHPDKVQHLSPEEQSKASKKASEINEAYSILEKAMNF